MDVRNRKRKHNDKHQRSQRPTSRSNAAENPPAIDPSLYVQAHEADLVRGPQAWEAARSLEVEVVEENGRKVVRPGSALIEWKPIRSESSEWEGDEHMTLRGKGKDKVEDLSSTGIWVDR